MEITEIPLCTVFQACTLFYPWDKIKTSFLSQLVQNNKNCIKGNAVEMNAYYGQLWNA